MEVNYEKKFTTYFERPVAKEAAQPLSDGSEIEFKILDEARKEKEVFTFTRASGQNAIRTGPASDPQLGFSMTPAAAERILAEDSEDIGQIGVGIARLVVNPDPQLKVGMHLYSGFWVLFKKGYLGVVKAGGKAFARFLAERGFGGVNGVKNALKKIRG